MITIRFHSFLQLSQPYNSNINLQQFQRIHGCSFCRAVSTSHRGGILTELREFKPDLLISQTGSRRDPVSVDDSGQMGLGESADLNRESEFTISRLRECAERIRVAEMEVFTRKGREQVSDEEREFVEKMSKEIVNRFLQYPIEYLRSGGGKCCRDSRVKMGDLQAIERMICSCSRVT